MNLPVPSRSFSSRLAEHYAGVRMRLRAPEFIAPVSASILLLPYMGNVEVQSVVDPIPDQRGKDVIDIMPIGTDLELIAARRALTAFARLRRQSPAINSVRHLQIAVAGAFKVDLWSVLGRSRRRGPARIRQIAMFLAHQVCSSTREDVARRFDRNHATVMYAEKKFVGLLEGASSQVGVI